MSDADSKPGAPLASGVTSWNDRSGSVTMMLDDITDTGGAPINSPHFTGTMTVPTVAPTDDSAAPATTSWVRGLLATSGGGDGGAVSGLALQVVPPTTGSTLITCVYNSQPEGDAPPGMAWCHMFDNPVYAWIVDPAGSPIEPVILGTLPDWTPPPTEPVVSPRWVVREQHIIYIPDYARGNAHWLFNFLAFNNGAQRPLYADFSDVDLTHAWQAWVAANPKLALGENPAGGEPGIDPAKRSRTR